MHTVVCYNNPDLKEITINNDLVVIKNNRLVDGDIIIEPIKYAHKILCNSLRNCKDNELEIALNKIINQYINLEKHGLNFGIII